MTPYTPQTPAREAPGEFDGVTANRGKMLPMVNTMKRPLNKFAAIKPREPQPHQLLSQKDSYNSQQKPKPPSSESQMLIQQRRKRVNTIFID